MFAHELGHYVDQALRLTDKLLGRAYAAVVRRLPEILSSGCVYLPTNAPAVTDLIVQEVLTNWIREAIADCFAILVLGPAYYFCHAEIQGLLGGNALSASGVIIEDWATITHPRPSLRIAYQRRTMANLLRKLPGEVRQLVRDIQTALEKRAQVRYHGMSISRNRVTVHLLPPVYIVLEQVWLSLLPHITRLVSTKVPDVVRFTADDYALAVTMVQEKLEWLIPPNEHAGRPMKPSVILNAGWYARRFALEKMRSRIASLPNGLEGSFQVVDILNGLLKYALYAAHVHSRWKSA